MSVYYLHGFASGPQSRKARFFKERLAEFGVELQTPELSEGDFTHLTLTRQLALLERLIGDGPHVLIGSSLGGYLAALYAAAHPLIAHPIARLVLLAPAFGFAQLWEAKLGPDVLSRWRHDGSLDVFHYGENRDVPLAYEFFADACHHEAFPKVTQPVLIFHGEADPVVPVEQSLAFVRGQPQARLVQLPSGHELTDVLEDIWAGARGFILGGPPG